MTSDKKKNKQTHTETTGKGRPSRSYDANEVANEVMQVESEYVIGEKYSSQPATKENT
jgi:hypothetical protein